MRNMPLPLLFLNFFLFLVAAMVGNPAHSAGTKQADHDRNAVFKSPAKKRSLYNALRPTVPSITVISYGRKSGDGAVNQKAVEASLRTLLSECDPPPAVHYIDDVEPPFLEKTLGDKNIPKNSLFLINSHGLPRSDSTGSAVGLDLVPSPASTTKMLAQIKTEESEKRLNGENLIRAILKHSSSSNIWLSACHSGSCSFFLKEEPIPGICLGSECDETQLASFDSPVFSKFSKVFCSAYGKDNCKLFNANDTDQDGKLSPEEIQNYLAGPPINTEIEKSMVSQQEIPQYQADCLARKGSFSTSVTKKVISLIYDFEGEDHLKHHKQPNVKFLDPARPNLTGTPLQDLDPQGGVRPEPGKSWDNLKILAGGKRQRSLAHCENADLGRSLARHLYGEPRADGTWATCQDTAQKWSSIPAEIQKHCKLHLPPIVSDPIGYEKNFPAAQRKETQCAFSETSMLTVKCTFPKTGIESPASLDSWGRKNFNPKISGLRVFAPWCKNQRARAAAP
jgi:hypothetical protein